MEPYYQDATLTLLTGKAEQVLPTLEPGSAACVVTSPPYYGLRDYEGHPDQLGMEDTPAEYVAKLAAICEQVKRVLADDGTFWLNLGDSYSVRWGSKRTEGRRGFAADARGRTGAISHDLPEKNLLGIPWRVAFALQDQGWILRNAIAWNKPNAMPESVQDRLANRHEMLFLLVKSRRYWFDLDPIREPLARPEALAEGIVFGGTKALDQVPRHRGGSGSVYGGNGKHDQPQAVPPGTPAQTNMGATGSRHTDGHPKGRNPGDVWAIPTAPFPGAHFATFPIKLPRRCILAGCRPGGVVLDPFSGAGTTAMAAQQLGRPAIGIDLNSRYHDIALRRMSDAPLPFDDAASAL